MTIESLRNMNSNEVLYLNSFDQEALDDNNDTVQTQGCVFTSPFFAMQIDALVSKQATGVHLMVDGTYKLAFNGWVLVILAGHCVNFSSNGITQIDIYM